MPESRRLETDDNIHSTVLHKVGGLPTCICARPSSSTRSRPPAHTTGRGSLNRCMVST